MARKTSALAALDIVGEGLAQQDGLAAICAAAGFGFGLHRTDHPPETALLALYTALSPEPRRR